MAEVTRTTQVGAVVVAAASPSIRVTMLGAIVLAAALPSTPGRNVPFSLSLTIGLGT
jgi:hypothetical protein